MLMILNFSLASSMPFLSVICRPKWICRIASSNFYSDNINRYSKAEDYKDAKSHGQFDLPHVVIMIGYDFGKGWTMGSEIEFEHGGTESAVEMEQEEVGAPLFLLGGRALCAAYRCTKQLRSCRPPFVRQDKSAGFTLLPHSGRGCSR